MLSRTVPMMRGVLLALGLGVLFAPTASAIPPYTVPPYFRPIPNTYFGYETTLLQQAYYRYQEQMAAQYQTPSGSEYTTERRYVTVVSPDNNARTFIQIVPRAVPRVAAPTFRFGSNH